MLIPHVRNTEPETTTPAAVGAEGEKEGGTAAAAGEEDKEGEVAAAAGEEGTEEGARRWYAEGEKMGGVYIQSVACRVCMQLSLAQFVSFRESSSSRRSLPLSAGNGRRGRRRKWQLPLERKSKSGHLESNMPGM